MKNGIRPLVHLHPSFQARGRTVSPGLLEHRARLLTGLSQRAFTSQLMMPLATLKDLEQGRRTPPSYVIRMIDHLYNRYLG